MKRSLNCRGNIIEMNAPWVMAVLNATPDSFFKGSQFQQVDQALAQVEKMLAEGADIIDVGGYSSRPGATEVTASEERSRIMPIIKAVHQRFSDLLISVDSYRSAIAEEAVAEGASIINDISAGSFDPRLLETVGKLKVPYILMHLPNQQNKMHEEKIEGAIEEEVTYYFSQKIKACYAAGIKDLILDPGFGFGKSMEQNYRLIKAIDSLQHQFQLPVLGGISRKRMVYQLLGISADEALNGTTVLNTLLLMKGANILRVHDVKAAKEAIKIVHYYQMQ